MAEKIRITADVELTPIVVSNKIGTKVGAAFINLDDVRIPSRITEIIEYAKTIVVESCDSETLVSFCDMLEDKFCKLFGYDCRRSLFGILSPVDLCGGKYYYIMIIEAITAKISEEVKANAQKRADKIAKYTRSAK